MQLMMNIAPWTIYYGMFPFKNAVLAAEDFHANPIYQLQNCCTVVNNQVTAINIEFDQYGWPTSLSGTHGIYGSQQATLYMGSSDINDFMPAGTYLLGAKGSGWISVLIESSTSGFLQTQFFQFTGTDDTLNTVEVQIVNPPNSGVSGNLHVPNISISLWETSSPNYLRDVVFMMPDPAHATATSPSTTPYAVNQVSIWHDTYISELRGDGPGYSAFRMMDLLGTNDSAITDWSQLAQCDSNLIPLGTTSYGDQVQIPYQVLLNLMHAVNPAADVWWNIPFHATDAFVTSCAQFLQANFPNKVYVEFSNEVWNGLFQQFTDAVNAGATQFGNGTYSSDSQGYGYNRQWYGYRTKQVHDLFRSAFATDANPSRMVPILAARDIGGADQPGSVWAQYIATGTAYAQNMAPTLSINGYYGAGYAGTQTNAQGQSLTAVTLAAGKSAVLAAWGPPGAPSVGPDWVGTANFAASIGSQWLIYEGSLDSLQFSSCSQAATSETQTLTIGSATGGTFTLTMPFSQVPNLTLPSPYQPLPSPRTDATTPAIAWNATPNQVRSALGNLPGMADANGSAQVQVTTTNASGLNSPVAPGDVLTIAFGLDPDDNPPNEWGFTTYNDLPLPLLTVQPTLSGGSAPTAARVAAGRQSDCTLMLYTITEAQADASNAGLITALLSYAAAAGAGLFGFYDSVANTIWGIKPYQGADPSVRPISQGVSSYLTNPTAYPATPLPPPPLSLTSIAVSPSILTAAGRFTITIAISETQTTATQINISVDHPQYFLSPPSYITVPAGQTTASFVGTVASAIPSTETATFSATLSYQTLDAEVTIMPFNPPYTLNQADSRASACIAFYPFYEGSGTTIHDCGPYGMHLLLQRGTIGTDAVWSPGPGAGTAGAGQYCMRIPAQGAFFTTPVAGLTLSQASVSAIMTIQDNQNAAQGPNYDQGLPAIQWYNPQICQPIGRFGGGDSYYSQVQDPAFSGNTAASGGMGNPTPAQWVQHGFASTATGSTYYVGSQHATAGYPATPTGTIATFGIPCNGYGAPFAGSIAGLALFNRALTDAELQMPLAGLMVPVPLATIGTVKPYLPSAAGARPRAKTPAAAKAARRLFRPR